MGLQWLGDLLRIGDELALRVQLGEHPAKLHQLSVASLFDELTVLEDQNHVGRAHGRQAVSDNECGSTLHERVQCALDACLGCIVEGAGRLIENEQRGVFEHRSCDRQPLTFAPESDLPCSATTAA